MEYQTPPVLASWMKVHCLASTAGSPGDTQSAVIKSCARDCIGAPMMTTKTNMTPSLFHFIILTSYLRCGATPRIRTETVLILNQLLLPIERESRFSSIAAANHPSTHPSSSSIPLLRATLQNSAAYLAASFPIYVTISCSVITQSSAVTLSSYQYQKTSTVVPFSLQQDQPSSTRQRRIQRQADRSYPRLSHHAPIAQQSV